MAESTANPVAAQTAAEYDGHADTYNKWNTSAKAPWGEICLRPSVFRAMGDPAGKRVLDLGCGEGLNAQQAAEKGAVAVYGIDVSPSMVEGASKRPVPEGRTLEFQVADCSDEAAVLGALPAGSEGTFDVVMACFLFNYAKDEAHLHRFADIVFKLLRPGGRLVGLNSNPAATMASASPFEKFSKWGFIRRYEGDSDGSAIHISVLGENGEADMGFTNYHFGVQTYARVFAAAGFAEFGLDRPRPDPELMAQHKCPAGYFDELYGPADADSGSLADSFAPIAACPAVVISATKPAATE